VGLSYGSDQAVDGNFFPDFERLLGITYLPTRTARGPYTAVATVGSYSARGRLSGREVGCFMGAEPDTADSAPSRTGGRPPLRA
jgi:hypothetical protein